MSEGAYTMAGRPHVLSVRFKSHKIVARMVDMPDSGNPGDLICLRCVPHVTVMKPHLEVTQWGLWDDKHVTCFICETCGSVYGVQYIIQHETGGVRESDWILRVLDPKTGEVI